MRTVFGAAFLKLLEEFHLVELVVLVGIGHAVKSSPAVRLVVDHDIQGVERVKQSLGMAHVDFDFLDLHLANGLGFRHHNDMDVFEFQHTKLFCLKQLSQMTFAR